MGNSLGSKKTIKIMKITGETFKLKTPVKAGEVVKDYPGHVLLESEAVKHYGTRAKPIQDYQELVAKRLYFLVELPKPTAEKVPRRVHSGINMNAKERLESLMLARRSVSDLTIMKNSSSMNEGESENGGNMRVKMRLPKAEVEKLMKESKDETEAAAKIMELCMANKNNKKKIVSVNTNNDEIISGNNNSGLLLHNNYRETSSAASESVKAREKRRVSFLPVSEAEMQIAVASY